MIDVKYRLHNWLDDVRGATLGDDHAKMRLFNAAGSDEQSIVSDPHGGFLVPEEWRPSLEEVGLYDPTIELVTTVPMSTNVMNVPARVDKTHTTSQTGGLTTVSRSETQSATSSRGEVELVTLQAHSITGLVYSTTELVDDNPAAAGLLIRRGLAQQLGYYLLDKKINGTGVGEPEGILNSPCAVTATRGATGLYLMAGVSWRLDQSIWLANPEALEPTIAAAHKAGTNSDNFAYRDGLILGRPLFLTEFCPATTAAGDVILWQPSEYMLGVRNEILTESIYVRFAEHENAYRFVCRCDGRMWWRSALTPKNGAATLSPVVVLAA